MFRGKGATDLNMLKGLPLEVQNQVRAIDFRKSDPALYPPGYNIVSWSGQQTLEKGTLEYLEAA